MTSLSASILTLLLVPLLQACAQDATPPHAQPPAGAASAPEALLASLVGTWRGTCRTWLTPGKLSDESPITGTFSAALDGPIIRHAYQSTIHGTPRHGEELIACNGITHRIQISWFDSFHMNYALMDSVGDPVAGGFAVKGSYDVGANERQWGWKTVYSLVDPNHLTITAYNITPGGQEAKAIETTYTRVQP